MKEIETKKVEQIRDSYLEKSEAQNKYDELVSLDKKVTRPAEIFAYTFGSISALILGIGMCMTMGVLFQSLSFAFVLGIIIGCVGLLFCGLNYFIYKAILSSRKKKYGKEIIRRTDELLNK